MSIRKRKGTNKWVHDYIDSQGKRHQRLYETQREAKAAETLIRHELSNNVHVPDTATVTVKEAANAWLTTCERELEASTVAQYRGHVVNHIVPNIGRELLTKISVPLIHAFLEKLRTKGCSEPLIRNVRVSLGSILEQAQREGKVARNVAKDVGRTKSRTADRHKPRLKVGVDIPTTDEVRRIIEAAKDGRPRLFLRTAALTGMRASELRGLSWAAVDLAEGKIEVFQRADYKGKIGSPKSGSGRRSIPIGPQLVAELRRWKVACPSRDLVFPSLYGKPMNHSNLVTDWLHPACVAGGVVVMSEKQDKHGKPLPLPKYTGLHAFRHFYASHCINPKSAGGLGLDPKVVQERMGHSSILLTLDVYGHLFPKGDTSAELAAAEAALF